MAQENPICCAPSGPFGCCSTETQTVNVNVTIDGCDPEEPTYCIGGNSSLTWSAAHNAWAGKFPLSRTGYERPPMLFGCFSGVWKIKVYEDDSYTILAAEIPLTGSCDPLRAESNDISVMNPSVISCCGGVLYGSVVVTG